jgi:hypothetical protein
MPLKKTLKHSKFNMDFRNFGVLGFAEDEAPPQSADYASAMGFDFKLDDFISKHMSDLSESTTSHLPVVEPAPVIPSPEREIKFPAEISIVEDDAHVRAAFFDSPGPRESNPLAAFWAEDDSILVPSPSIDVARPIA